ncbi:MAG: sugar phosphate isomerase/epimerase [Verrucomicrobiales bacterium]|jgi:sugar phosphate isomerase/epimerase|nr:sugar phosphate isomerase/epimerase [Verrucomicrobiales bacterium]
MMNHTLKNTLSALALTFTMLGTGVIVSAEIETGLQAYTYRALTFFETVDKARELGIPLLEAYPGQRLGGGLDGKFGHDMSDEQRQKVVEKLNAAGVTLCSYGVVGAGDEASWRKIFAFARDMKLRWVTVEPPPDKLPLLDLLANEYNIPLAVHNHPTPSAYANPAVTKTALASLSDKIGVCADTGHWGRSGFVPAQALAMLSGRIRSLHLADVSQLARGARDVPFGTGAANISAVLAELKRQNFHGVAIIEYEHQSPDLDKDVSQCVEYLRANKPQ